MDRAKRKVTEFDILTTDDFNELLQLIKVGGIALDDDVLLILFNRLGDDYPKGSWDRRHAVIKLANYIADNWEVLVNGV